MLDVVFNGFHNNDGVIDDQSNQKNEPEKRQGVNGEAEHGKDGNGRVSIRETGTASKNEWLPPALWRKM